MGLKLRVLALKLWNRFRPTELDDEFDAELQTHLTMLVDERVRRGMPVDEATRVARLRLGGLAQLKEQHREQRTLAWIDALGQDLRYALRTFRRSPGFTAVAVVTSGRSVDAPAPEPDGPEQPGSAFWRRRVRSADVRRRCRISGTRRARRERVSRLSRYDR